MRLRRGVRQAAGVALSLAVGVTTFAAWGSLDRTRGLTPEVVTVAAGRAIISAKAYWFTVSLVGESAERHFPASLMTGSFQRTPPVLHLAGEAGVGEKAVSLEYYLEGERLFVRHAQNQDWLLMTEGSQIRLRSFQPDFLAEPLISGLRGASFNGRERLPGGEAVVLRLDLDPVLMKERLGELGAEQAEYRLWIYTRSLKPARFTVEVRLPLVAARPGQALRYRYAVEWDFRRADPVAVPEGIKRMAREQ